MLAWFERNDELCIPQQPIPVREENVGEQPVVMAHVGHNSKALYVSVGCHPEGVGCLATICSGLSNQAQRPHPQVSSRRLG